MSARIVLASASAGRAAALEKAGVAAVRDPADIDEAAFRKNFTGDTQALATALACEKAVAVSRRHPGAFVIGGDQILDCAGRRFDKAATMEEARQKLLILRGREHRLVTAICVARDGEIVWRHVENPRMVMRDFSNAFLDDYLAGSGEKILASVGCYLLEDGGAPLFEKIEGDYFSILGLPLLPLLGWLREQGVLQK